MVTIGKRDDKGVRIISAGGKLNTGAEDLKLREAIVRSIQEGKTRILVDLQEVDFLATGGICELVGGRKHCLERGGDLKIVLPRHHLPLEVLVITQLVKWFDSFKTVQEGLAAF